jgi:hypothetical protein
MAAVGELVPSATGQWMVRPPQRCLQGHASYGDLVAKQIAGVVRTYGTAEDPDA